MTARSTSRSRASCCCPCGLAPVVTVASGTRWGDATPCLYCCVFSKTMYLDRQRYTVSWPYTICRPNTKTKISRTRGHTTRRHTRTDFFFGMYQLETRFARIICTRIVSARLVSVGRRGRSQHGRSTGHNVRLCEKLATRRVLCVFLGSMNDRTLKLLPFRTVTIQQLRAPLYRTLHNNCNWSGTYRARCTYTSQGVKQQASQASPPPPPVGWALRSSPKMAIPVYFSYKYHNGCGRGHGIDKIYGRIYEDS